MLIDFVITQKNLSSGVATFTLPESFECNNIRLVRTLINITETATTLKDIFCTIGGIDNLKPFIFYDTTNTLAKTINIGHQQGTATANKHDIDLVHMPTTLATGTNITFTFKQLTLTHSAGPPASWSVGIALMSDDVLNDGASASTQSITITLDLDLDPSFNPAIND